MGIFMQDFDIDLEDEIQYKLSKVLIESGERETNMTIGELKKFLEQFDENSNAVNLKINYRIHTSNREEVTITTFGRGKY